ncbi:MAG: GvpL/GvpF family gas vesicle protein [Candidatus Euphemobacter frigidus]|nr:GvpL/GvpF family gas vesicle protein [Candidatus Euphemobacter frigidus]MDP8274783.1 GvpL/GvpF family gas vesicle protein [Candidatus Euphemobacter frigidus]
MSEEITVGRSLYLYCIAGGNEKINLGPIGIEGGRVYSIPHREVSAIVHDCEARPYESGEAEKVKNWVMIHQQVVDTAWERFGTVLPMSFDTLIVGGEGIEPEENLKKWLQEDYEKLREKFSHVRGKAEYGVQILWDPRIMVDKIAENSPEIRNLKEEVKSKSPGVAYMYEQKVKNLLRREMENKADEYFKDFYQRIKKEVFDIHIDKTKKGDNEQLQMIMNLSCLVSGEKVEKLGDVLEGINREEGLHIRFTGPWPPYSFA